MARTPAQQGMLSGRDRCAQKISRTSFERILTSARMVRQHFNRQTHMKGLPVALKPLTAQEKKSLIRLFAGAVVVVGIVFAAMFFIARP
jgi:hypothetical protein